MAIFLPMSSSFSSPTSLLGLYSILSSGDESRVNKVLTSEGGKKRVLIYSIC